MLADAVSQARSTVPPPVDEPPLDEPHTVLVAAGTAEDPYTAEPSGAEAGGEGAAGDVWGGPSEATAAAAREEEEAALHLAEAAREAEGDVMQEDLEGADN